MDITEFINSKRYSRAVKVGGMEYLIERWRDRCKRIPYNSRYFFLEYLNDLGTREIIFDISNNCILSEEQIDEISLIDKVFVGKTVEIDKCLFGVNLEKEYDKEHYWFYYRIPEERIEDWKTQIGFNIEIQG